MSCFSTIVRRKEDANEFGLSVCRCLVSPVSEGRVAELAASCKSDGLGDAFHRHLACQCKGPFGGKKDLWKSSFILCLFNQFFIIFQLSYWHLKLDALTYFNGSIVPCYSKGLFYTLFLFVTLSWFQKFHYSHIWHECFCCMRFSLYH